MSQRRKFLSSIFSDEEITAIIEKELEISNTPGVNSFSLLTQFSFIDDNVPGGAYGCWKRNINKTWCSKSKDRMTSSEWSAHLIRIKAAQAKASENAKIILSKAKPADNNNPYLLKKNIRSHGLHLDSENRLIIPLFGADKKLYSLQFISAEGDKRFLSGGLISGNYFPIGNVKNPTGKIYIGEGYATCMTLYQATGCYPLLRYLQA